MSALAQEHRLTVFGRLVRAGIAGLSAGDLAALVNAPHNTMSAHLAILTRAGLLSARREGRSIRYAVDPSGAEGLLTYLARESFGAHPDLCAGLREALDSRLETHAPLRAWPGRPVNVLFLCTANSARSIMAEAILRALGGGSFAAFSAGTRPAAHPMPMAIRCLEDEGVPVSGLRSKPLEEFLKPAAPRMDMVIALCGILEGRDPPEPLRRAPSAEWLLPDPAKFSGRPAERRALMRQTIAGLRRRLARFVRTDWTRLDKPGRAARLEALEREAS